MRHKGPIVRPRCIGPGRTRTQKPFNSSCNMSAGPTHTRHFRAPYSLLYPTALMSAANILLYLNPETVVYVFNRHHTQFHQRNLSSSKSVRIKHLFPSFLGRTMSHHNSSYKHVSFSLYIIRSHLLSMLLTTVSFCITRSILRSF